MGTSSAAFFRSMGGAVGTAVFISMLFSLAADKIATGMKDAAQNADYLKVLKDPAVAADPANAKLYDFFKNGASNDSLNDTSWLHTANPTLTRPITEGFAQSIDAVMLTAAVLTGIAFLITLRPAEQETHGPEGGRPGGCRGRRPLGRSRRQPRNHDDGRQSSGLPAVVVFPSDRSSSCERRAGCVSLSSARVTGATPGPV